MPIPKQIKQINKHVTNRFFLLFAGWIPPLAIIEHDGRKSGRRYLTPILAFPTTAGFVLALTYGKKIDWAKNLLSTGGGLLVIGGSRIPLHKPHLTSYDDVKKYYPLVVRWFLEILNVTDYILVEKQCANAPDAII